MGSVEKGIRLLDMDIVLKLSQELAVQKWQVEAAVKLIDEARQCRYGSRDYFRFIHYFNDDLYPYDSGHYSDRSRAPVQRPPIAYGRPGHDRNGLWYRRPSDEPWDIDIVFDVYFFPPGDFTGCGQNLRYPV